MAGSNPSFNPAFFRSAIKQAMNMGVPTDTAKRLTWHFKSTVAYEIEDPADNPYDWTETPTSTVPDAAAPSGTAVVDYALEFAARSGGSGSANSSIGDFDTSRAIVTLLDVDFEKIKTADWATVGDTHYEIDFSGPPIGMFEVVVYQIYLTTADS